MPITCKVFETEQAVLLGAGEIDMIMNVGAFKECAPDYLLKEVSEVVKAAKGLPVKVILETCYLTDAEKIKAAKICADAGASFVKSSTASAPRARRFTMWSFSARPVPDHVKVKASGGIRTWKDAKALIEAGATARHVRDPSRCSRSLTRSTEPPLERTIEGRMHNALDSYEHDSQAVAGRKTRSRQ